MHRREAVFLLRKLLVAGGDGRMLRLARMLAGNGFAVSTLGLVSGDEKTDGVTSAEALLFPYPFAVRDGRVPTLTGLTLHPEDVLESARPGAALLAGRALNPSWRRRICRQRGFGCSSMKAARPFWSETRTCPLRARWHRPWVAPATRFRIWRCW